MMNVLTKVSIQTQMLVAMALPVSALVYFSVVSNSIVALGAIAAAIICSVFFSQQIKRRLKYAKQVAGQISDDRIHEQIDVHGGDEIASVVQEIKHTQKKLLDWGDWQIGELENTTRIKNGLDNVHSSVILIDGEFKIIYLNETAKEMFLRDEAHMRKDIPEFDAKNIKGQSIDVLYKGVPEERAKLNSLHSAQSSELVIGGRTFRVIANPVNDEKGERIGAVLEWEDRTETLNVQSEVQALVDAALVGDLSQRISIDNKSGFFKFLSEGINNLVDVSEQVINDTIRVFSAMSQGNLTEHIDTKYQGAYNQLKSDANETISRLTEIVTNIKDSSDLVNSAANEISEGNLNLSQRTESQASSLEETSSSMVEMTSTVQQNAENSKQANELAVSASDQAKTGGRVVSNAVSAMDKINESSEKISNIIGVINEIAFQTNLLALNAAVEAARAGEQGRGFAVVASEVRNLAGRSATAAKEIKELIEDSVTKVEEGTLLVNQSGETLKDIMNSVKEVADIIGDISTASQEQASGIEQVNKTIMNMDESTQQNAALVEQVSASAESMNEQSKELKKLVEFFNVDDSADDDQVFPQKDRRSSSRPWGDKNSDQPCRVDQTKKAVGDDFEDSGWEEF